MRTAEQLSSRAGLRGPTYATIYGLLAATGMRISEVIALDVDDVDLRHGVITIRRTKFGKSRLLPLHDSTVVALESYAHRRDKVVVRACDGFFLSEKGDRISQWGTRYNFAQVSRKVGLRSPGGRHGHGPRIHDMRHRFAVRTLIAWYRAGLDAERELPRLSTYLGHAHVADTYWYIEAVPELPVLAGAGGVSHEEAVDWADTQYIAFTERRRVEAEVRGAERYLDDLAATAKRLEGERQAERKRPPARRAKKKT